MNYLGRYASLRYARWPIVLSSLGCLVAVVLLGSGILETQQFVLSKQSDLQSDPALYNPSLAFNKLAAHLPLYQILIYMTGLKFQLGIAAGLGVRVFGLLIRNRAGAVASHLALLSVLITTLAYLAWSLDLLYCAECLQANFLIAVPPGVSYLFLLSIVLVVTDEIVFLLRLVTDRRT
jgi:hypothetical protein